MSKTEIHERIGEIEAKIDELRIEQEQLLQQLREADRE